MNSDNMRDRARRSLLAAVRGLVLALITMPFGIAFLVLTLVSLAFVPLGIGLLTTPSY
ncbi:hypothetical protein GA0115256_126421 [Streptomyces sp. DconLS]|nr:hypothetical protein GA0115256_126421 [Streptomyces sp. DconLS]